MMEIETIYGQVIAKANHYQAVPGKFGTKRIIKDEKIRAYEHSFIQQCRIYRNKGISSRFRGLFADGRSNNERQTVFPD